MLFQPFCHFFFFFSPSPKKHQLSFIISKVIISRSAPPILPKQGLSSSIPPGKFNFYNEIVTSFCIFFNLSDRFSYLKKEPPSFRESMSTKCLPTQLLNGFRGRFPEFLSIFLLFSQASGESHFANVRSAGVSGGFDGRKRGFPTQSLKRRSSS